MTASEHWRDDWREHRPTPSQRLHEVTMAALSRGRSGPESIEVGQEARTKEWYVKSLVIHRGDDEPARDWIERMGNLAAEAVSVLPLSNGGAE